MRLAIAIIIGALLLAAGCSQKNAVDTKSPDVAKPTLQDTVAEQEVIQSVQGEFIPEDETAEIGSMI